MGERQRQRGKENTYVFGLIEASGQQIKQPVAEILLLIQVTCCTTCTKKTGSPFRRLHNLFPVLITGRLAAYICSGYRWYLLLINGGADDHILMITGLPQWHLYFFSYCTATSRILGQLLSHDNRDIVCAYVVFNQLKRSQLS